MTTMFGWPVAIRHQIRLTQGISIRTSRQRLYLSTEAAYKSGCATICCIRATAVRNDSTELTELKRNPGYRRANDRRIGRRYGTRKPRLRDSPAGNHRRLDGIDGARHRHGR